MHSHQSAKALGQRGFLNKPLIADFGLQDLIVSIESSSRPLDIRQIDRYILHLLYQALKWDASPVGVAPLPPRSPALSRST